MNRLQFYSAREPETQRGFREIIVTEAAHPYSGHWWPPGHLLGYEHSFVHTIADFVTAVVRQKRAANFRRRARNSARTRNKQWITV
jgi:hypothetical protein